jgi:hypothetical protein
MSCGKKLIAIRTFHPLEKSKWKRKRCATCEEEEEEKKIVAKAMMNPQKISLIIYTHRMRLCV